MKTKRKILATTALPYANGPLHLGHMVEHIQADIWMRFQKMQGHDCLFICGDDAHGTPIMISAEKQGISPEELIANIKRSHEADFKAFNISFDNFYTTHSPENRELSTYIYKKLQERGDISTRTIQQAFDPVKNMFLPDRYVKGECPRCGAKDQYGDNCEACGATYTPADLKNPVSAISGATPVWKDSVHYFFQLDNYKNMLSDWLATEVVSSAIRNKLNEWFEAGLEPWDISRDAPYFGFEIPDAPGKYFYVWLDAPVGYMASLKNLIARNPDINFDDYWAVKNNSELYHFIGKDIVYFHALFWPAMLEGSGFRKPTGIFTHGYLTINGLKMSKSRGTFITAHYYLQYLNPEYLRYYFAAKLGAGVDDIDLSLEDFMQRVNSDLIGKVINIASRCAGFITKYFDNKLADQLDEPELLNLALAKRDEIAKLYESLHYNQAVREIMTVADIANQYIDKKKPWLMAKNPDELAEVQKVASTGLNLFRIIIGYLKPILPNIAKMSEGFLNTDALTWQNLTTPLLSHTINTYQPLITRIEKSQIESLINANEVNV